MHSNYASLAHDKKLSCLIGVKHVYCKLNEYDEIENKLSKNNGYFNFDLQSQVVFHRKLFGITDSVLHFRKHFLSFSLSPSQSIFLIKNSFFSILVSYFALFLLLPFVLSFEHQQWMVFVSLNTRMPHAFNFFFEL